MFSKYCMWWETFLHKHFFLPEHPLVWIGLCIIQYFIRKKKYSVSHQVQVQCHV